MSQMVPVKRSYSSVVSEDPSKVQLEVFSLIRDGKSGELRAFLCVRQYACSLLTSVQLNPSNNESYSLLMIAALHGHDLVVHEILSHSPDREKTVELEGRVHDVSGGLVDKVTALWCALDRAHFTVAHTLIEFGKANVNHGPVHPLLIDAAIRGRLDIVQFIVENNYVDVNQTTTNDENKSDSLIESARHGHIHIVDYLLKKTSELNSKTNVNVNSALAIAAIEGHLDIVRLLIVAGASSRIRNFDEKTPIALAAENKRYNVLDFFLEIDLENGAFDDLELTIALHIISNKSTIHYNSKWVIELLTYLFLQRIQHNVHKNVAQPTVVYDFVKECQSIEEFNSIKYNKDRLYIEALIMQERILLGQKDNKLFEILFDRANTLLKNEKFNHCLDLIAHIFHLSEQFQNQNYMKKFFSLFYTMFNSNIPIPINQFWKTFDLIFIPFDENHRRDQSYLLTTIAKMEPPSISLILNELKLNDDCILNIYFHSSWLEGTCNHDMIIITHKGQSQTDFDYVHQYESHGCINKYNVQIYTIENFQELLKQNDYFCVEFLFLSNEFKLKEQIDFRTIYLEKFYDPIQIKKLAFYQLWKSLDSIKNQSKIDVLFHGIKCFDFARQLIQTRTIEDFTFTSKLFNRIKQIHQQTNTENLVNFFRMMTDECRSILNILVPTNFIQGIFQVQIRFDSKSNIEQLKLICQNSKYIISLTYSDIHRNNQQLIVTSSYHGQYPSIIQQIKEDIHRYFQDFTILTIEIESLISNEGIPSNDIDQQLFWNEKPFSFQFYYQTSLNKQIIEIIEKNQFNFNTTFNCSSYFIQQIDHRNIRFVIQMILTNIASDNALKIGEQYLNYLTKTFHRNFKIQQLFLVYRTDIIKNKARSF